MFAVGVLLSNAQIGLVELPNGGSPQYALVASGTATLLGVSGITVTGTVSVQFNDTTKSFSETLTIPGSTSPGVTLDLAADAPASFAITGGQLGVLGQTLSGNFAFSDTNNTVVVAASDVSLSLGGGAVSIPTHFLGLSVFKNGYSTTFFLAFVLTSLGLTAFQLLIREPDPPRVRPRMKVSERLRGLPALLRSDRGFAFFMLAQTCAVAGRIAAPFYILYAGATLHSLT